MLSTYPVQTTGDHLPNSFIEAVSCSDARPCQHIHGEAGCVASGDFEYLALFFTSEGRQSAIYDELVDLNVCHQVCLATPRPPPIDDTALVGCPLHT